jgi:hypothetical protein
MYLEVRVGREVAQTMYIHVSKCKNNKIKVIKKIKSMCLMEQRDTLRFQVNRQVHKKEIYIHKYSFQHFKTVL